LSSIVDPAAYPDAIQAAVAVPDVSVIGTLKKEFPVSISTRFLEHFSEQLYSSPNKAFEELLANAWDANAQSAYVYLPPDPKAEGAAIYVLDNGLSMDEGGLEDLWKVAYSKKTAQQTTGSGRAVIGKFGIGKLATYVLAEKLTYICRSADGVIRAVTMDYTALGENPQQLIGSNVQLKLRELSADDLKQLLESSTDGTKIHQLITSGVPSPKSATEWENEFGGVAGGTPAGTGSWTLVVLTSLKKRGKDIKAGIVRRMIQTALPLGAELNIVLNGERLTSSKSELPVIQDWEIGPDLGITEITLPAREGAESEESDEIISVRSLTSPFPCVEIDGIGKLTGRVKLFEERISFGKSEENAPSNGFFVNVRGRVTNSNPYFGLKDLSHSAWSRFRMTVRADGLNDLLSVNREQFSEQRELRIFRAFLRAAFNKARTRWEEYGNWGDSGKAIVQSYGMLPLLSFRNYIEESLDDCDSETGLMDLSGIQDIEAAGKEYRSATQNDLREALKGVRFEERGPNAGLVSYSLRDRAITVNSSHPFIAQHTEDKAQKQAIQDAMLVDVLTEVHAHDLGIDSVQISELRRARDRMARIVAKIHRRSGSQIAKLLLEVSTHPDYRALEIIVGDALEYLGLQVTRIGGSGEPEGIARAKLAPAKDGVAQAFSFSYDAKSSGSGKAQTGNCNIAGLARHRENHEVDHVLLVAPDFQAGALVQECATHDITPIRAKDLGRLLILSAEYGAIPLTKLREIFNKTSPDDVAEWVNSLENWLQGQRNLTLSDLIATFETLEIGFPDVVSVSVLADRCRQVAKKPSIKETDVRRVLVGLQIIVPDLIQVDGDKVAVTVHPNKLAEAIQKQLNAVKSLDASAGKAE
jgi:hypothetical protein